MTANARKGRTKERSHLEEVVENDVSMVRRRRARGGYGLSDVCLSIRDFHRASGGAYGGRF